MKRKPANIIKACKILGLDPDELSLDTTRLAWKRLVVSASPDDLGTDAVLSYNGAKDAIVQSLEFETE